MTLLLIRCKCGQALGKVEGHFEFRCHKCKTKFGGEAKGATLLGLPVVENDTLAVRGDIVFGDWSGWTGMTLI